MADDRPTDDLDARIASARAAGQARVGPGAMKAKGYGQGSKVLALLLGSLFGGAVLGLAVDHWFDTSPWGLLVILTLAIVGAFLNILKISKERAQ